MRRALAIFLLVLSLTLSGCCFAPGYTGNAFWEMPDDVPDLPFDGYIPTNTQPGDSQQNQPRQPIPNPEVDLEKLPERKDTDMVYVLDYIPDLVVELRYATTDNFTGEQIYTFNDLYLRYGTVKKLMGVQEDLRAQGLLLKVWDGFRPVSAQKALWEAKPDPEFVANPTTGYSSHTRGNTVDVTVVDANGVEIEMPTDFDSFSVMADRDYSDCTERAAVNALLLQNIMEKHGFVGYSSEWWHYSDETEYEPELVFDPAVISTWYAVCNQYINIRVKPDVNAEAIGTIPKNARFILLGWSGDFAYVEYQGQRGYVNSNFMAPVE